MESGILFGLTAALFGEITLEQGRVQQSNFPSYEMVRLAQTPEIEVHIVNSGVEHLGGIGEVGTPPVAPAVLTRAVASIPAAAHVLAVDSTRAADSIPARVVVLAPALVVGPAPQTSTTS